MATGTPGAAMMLTVARTTLIGRRCCGSNPRYPPPNWRVGKMPARKADQNGCNMDMRDEDQAITMHMLQVLYVSLGVGGSKGKVGIQLKRILGRLCT